MSTKIEINKNTIPNSDGKIIQFVAREAFDANDNNPETSAMKKEYMPLITLGKQKLGTTNPVAYYIQLNKGQGVILRLKNLQIAMDSATIFGEGNKKQYNTALNIKQEGVTWEARYCFDVWQEILKFCANEVNETKKNTKNPNASALHGIMTDNTGNITSKTSNCVEYLIEVFENGKRYVRIRTDKKTSYNAMTKTSKEKDYYCTLSKIKIPQITNKDNNITDANKIFIKPNNTKPIKIDTFAGCKIMDMNANVEKEQLKIKYGEKSQEYLKALNKFNETEKIVYSHGNLNNYLGKRRNLPMLVFMLLGASSSSACPIAMKNEAKYIGYGSIESRSDVSDFETECLSDYAKAKPIESIETAKDEYTEEIIVPQDD